MPILFWSDCNSIGQWVNVFLSLYVVENPDIPIDRSINQNQGLVRLQKILYPQGVTTPVLFLVPKVMIILETICYSFTRRWTKLFTIQPFIFPRYCVFHENEHCPPSNLPTADSTIPKGANFYALLIMHAAAYKNTSHGWWDTMKTCRV